MTDKRGPRKSISDLDKVETEDLLRAFREIKQLDINDKDSFFYIASIHAAPISKEESQRVWCHHGTVLFPTWHRPYMDALEQALRKHVPEQRQENFRFPYWNSSLGEFPSIFMEENVTIDGKEVPNPLLSYTPPIDVIVVDDKGVEQVVIPKNTPTERGWSWIEDKELKKRMYLETIKGALQRISVPAFQRCLKTKEYRAFSNTGFDGAESQSLENPHNSLHLLSGGSPKDFVDYSEVPLLEKVPDTSAQLGERELFKKYASFSARNAAARLAQWDTYTTRTKLFHWIEIHWGALDPWKRAMSVVDISAFDPIFYFHHLNIDRFYWQWQEINGVENWEPEPPPQNPNAPDPWNATGIRGIDQNERLSLQTLLPPFDFTAGAVKDPKVLGISYDPVEEPSLEAEPLPSVVFIGNKTEHRGAFSAHVWEEMEDGKLDIVGSEHAFTRLFSSTCPNCRANPIVPLHVVITGASNVARLEAFPGRPRKFVGGIESAKPVNIPALAQ